MAEDTQKERPRIFAAEKPRRYLQLLQVASLLGPEHYACFACGEVGRRLTQPPGPSNYDWRRYTDYNRALAHAADFYFYLGSGRWLHLLVDEARSHIWQAAGICLECVKAKLNALSFMYCSSCWARVVTYRDERAPIFDVQNRPNATLCYRCFGQVRRKHYVRVRAVTPGHRGR